MKKTKIQQVTEDREITDDVLCNKCGKSCMMPLSVPLDSSTSYRSPYGLIDAKVYGGFYSDAISDRTRIEFDLCEKCVVQLFNSCAIPPIVHDDDVDPHPWDPEWHAKSESIRRASESRFEDRIYTWFKSEFEHVAANGWKVLSGYYPRVYFENDDVANVRLMWRICLPSWAPDCDPRYAGVQFTQRDGLRLISCTLRFDGSE